MDAPICRECGAFTAVDAGGICQQCRRVESRITPDYQRREHYAPVCPVCGRGMIELGAIYECPWCGQEQPGPAYRHQNATRTPAMDLPGERRRPTLRELMGLAGPPRGRR